MEDLNTIRIKLLSNKVPMTEKELVIISDAIVLLRQIDMVLHTVSPCRGTEISNTAKKLIIEFNNKGVSL